jgi:hypothetical protein
MDHERLISKASFPARGLTQSGSKGLSQSCTRLMCTTPLANVSLLKQVTNHYIVIFFKVVLLLEVKSHRVLILKLSPLGDLSQVADINRW